MHLHQHDTQCSSKRATCTLSLSFPVANGQPPITIPFDCAVEYEQCLPGVDLTLSGPVVDHEICTDTLTNIRLAVIKVVESADDATVKLNNGPASGLPLIGFSIPQPQFVPRGAGFAPGVIFYFNPTGGLTSIKFNSQYGMKINVSLFGT